MYSIRPYNSLIKSGKIETPTTEVLEGYKDFQSYDSKVINNYDEYENFINELNGKSVISKFSDKITKDTFKNNKVVAYTYSLNSCSEELISARVKENGTTSTLYLDINKKCGYCASLDETYIGIVSKNIEKTESKYKNIEETNCQYEMTEDKPIIYFYPEKEMNLTIKLGNPKAITHTYPKYNNSWKIHLNKNGNIYDYNTKRNYYALYWEGKYYSKLDPNEGFIVEGKDTIKFLEEKLEILGLNEREINEFIVYWLPKLENNKYNYFRFKSIDEINKYMPIELSEKPDTLIRVMVDMKPLNKNINVKEQKLTKIERKGFTVVEWGGSIIK